MSDRWRTVHPTVHWLRYITTPRVQTLFQGVAPQSRSRALTSGSALFATQERTDLPNADEGRTLNSRRYTESATPSSRHASVENGCVPNVDIVWPRIGHDNPRQLWPTVEDKTRAAAAGEWRRQFLPHLGHTAKPISALRCGNFPEQ